MARFVEAKPQFRIEITQHPATIDELISQNRENYKLWATESFGRIGGFLHSRLKGEKELREAARNTLSRAFAEEELVYFRKTGKNRVAPFI